MNSSNHPGKNKHSGLAELQTVEERLASEINHLHHELRRVRDGLEQVGGSSHELEISARQLSSNIKLCESDLKDNRKKQAKVLIQPSEDNLR